MTPPLELIVAMMPYASKLTVDGQEPPRNCKEADILATLLVQVAARMSEEAIRLASEPERDGDRLLAREEIRSRLSGRLIDSRQREGARRGLAEKMQGGLVGITDDGLFRFPDPEDGGLVIVLAEDVVAVIEEADSLT